MFGNVLHYRKLAYAGLFTIVLLMLFWLFETALRSPWGNDERSG